jgi:preprotein translocase subunit SecD
MIAEGRRAGAALLVAAAAVLGVAACTGGGERGPGGDSVTVRFTASAPEGGQPSADDLGRAADVLRQRLERAGIHAQVSTAPGSVSVAAPRGSEQDVRRLAATGQLLFRPVVVTAAVSDRSAAGVPAANAAQFNTVDCAATRPQDVNAVTAIACDVKGENKYLLGPGLLSGGSLTKATAVGPDAINPTWSIVVDMDPRGRSVWAAYTASHQGGQVAFVVDGKVLSAPTIQGTITGETQISGSFTSPEAKTLATILGSRPLPVVLSAS